MIRVALIRLIAYDMIRNLKERYHQDYNKDPSYSLEAHIKEVAMKDPRRAMIMRNKVEDLEKACIPLDDHLVINIFVDDVCDDYIREKLQPSPYDEVRDFISWYAKVEPQDACSMTCFIDQLEQTGVYPSDDIIRAIFNNDLHLSFISKEVQVDTVKTEDKGKAIGNAPL
ncbi:hypothetical protein L1987_46556 [Smallanthus sonchifolius]|uniref:Uncharacterized protein n=1 Tax=Smallanthus sonchifolius TaxID=185202 RepID=A0ACB9G031_9ASTR|nr:hypothetical protein L1987_46556 [Smallanthus sonchifolius]